MPDAKRRPVGTGGVQRSASWRISSKFTSPDAAAAAVEANRRTRAVVSALAAAEARRIVLDDALVASIRRLAASSAVWAARAAEYAEAS